MTLLVIGTDEAGYGPNLGPLVVAATVWRVACEAGAAEETFQRIASSAGVRADGAALWGDSKLIYHGGKGFAALEKGALAGIGIVTGSPPADWPALEAAIGTISPPSSAAAASGPTQSDWHLLDSLLLPHQSDREACRSAAASAAAALAAERIALVAIGCRAVYPREFNGWLDRGLNKSDILSRTTLDLAAGCARDTEEPALIWCDRHGGRKSYASLVGRHFDAPLVRAIEETPARSAYAVSPRCRIEFSVGGEARLPVALASMTAKYVRELAMSAFNRYWSSRVPGLAATAGYPVDARRWRNEAADGIRQAGVAEDDLWRRA
jgi:hypothetical protein